MDNDNYTNTNNDGGSNFWGWLLGGFLVVVLLVGVFWVFNPQWNTMSNTASTNNQTPQGGGPGVTSTTVSYIISDPTKYIDTTVVVDGKVGKIYTGRIFTLEDAEQASGTGILVLSRNPLPYPTGSSEGTEATPAPGQKIRVHGTFKKLSTIEVAKQLNINIDPQISLQYEGVPIIIADSVTLL